MSEVDDLRSDDEREDSDRDEDEEEHAGDPDFQTNAEELRNAKKWIRNAVAERSKDLSDEDVDRFFEDHPNIIREASENMPTVLHAIFDLVNSDDGGTIRAKTVKLLVQRVVRQFPKLLCDVNDKLQSPLFLAIKNRKKLLVDYMVRFCPKSNIQHLVDALESSGDDDKGRTCLHLAFEHEMKVNTLKSMLRHASDKALTIVDRNGKRPMHYAVVYGLCDVGIIEAFIEKDEEALRLQKLEEPNHPPKTFLDVDDEAKESVYQRHVKSKAEAPKKNLLEDVKRKTRDTSENLEALRQHRNRPSIDGPKFEEEMANKRHAPVQVKFDPKVTVHQEQAKPSGVRDPMETQERGGRTREKSRSRDKSRTRDKKNGEDEILNDREKQRQQLKEQERLGQDMTSTMRDSSRDRRSLGLVTMEDAARTHNTIHNSNETKAGSDIVANTPLKRAPIDEKTDTSKSRKITASRKSSKDTEHAAETSTKVIHLLKLHYLRTRSIEKATTWLYGTNPTDVQLFFDYQGLPPELKEDIFTKVFSAAKFDRILKFVRFTNVKVQRHITPRTKSQRPSDGAGRDDMEFFFNFLYEKGVRHILKVSISEGEGSCHSDEAIKKVLEKVTVEHLDWQKLDMDPQILCGISGQADEPTNQLRALDLRWSGNNATLRAWSEPEGLPLLQHLQVVNITIPSNTDIYESQSWIQAKKDEFEKRLNDNIANAQGLDQDSKPSDERHVTVHLHGVDSTTGQNTTSRGSDQSLRRQANMAPKRVITHHMWLECMEKFSASINTFWSTTRRECRAAGSNVPTRTVTGLDNDIVVALIDDGVALLGDNGFFADRVLEGKTFDYHDNDVGQYYHSAQGHGTKMARFILKVCPMAKIYPIRLKTHQLSDGKNQIDLESAALAIKAALEKKATIISMSWTIPVPTTDSAASQLFQEAVREACDSKVLMFASSPDRGQYTTHVYPSSMQSDRIFRIGAASADGVRFSSTDKAVDFIFPGVDVDVSSTNGAALSDLERKITGSSVATALAAGLAGTIIYCFKTSALAVKTWKLLNRPEMQVIGKTFQESDIEKISQHAAMKEAFERLGPMNEERFIQVWDTFELATQELEKAKSQEDKVSYITTLCSKLVK
ncbi:hypothetical protein N0V93_000048 [Gnomoniopsis smithogilvyi]|uniref:Peptidase S8/S53 domain-containing protein n=1 Tax=Gnomoniopsis smithogilvyi TaxID=1191159 RepID=A0A9W8Z2Y5_9PEZI|nr:hypothetical protein N0V93_000048 [Gnomoniopsis smithogilvyi]